jgi:ABC-type lipoprotein export system ATPase subunit
LTVPIVQLEGIFKYYEGGLLEVLRDITLEIAPKEWLTIMGPSGSGKSTLLHILGGLDLPDKGRVLFQGTEPRSVGAWGKLRARQIGFIFQAFNLLPTLTTLENIMVPMFGVTQGTREKRSRALHLLDRVGLSNRALHLPAQLSAGERQRVALARGLANNPSLLLADEPTGNLDSHSKKNIMALLKEIQTRENISLVLVTHDSSLIEYGHRLIHLVDGELS